MLYLESKDEPESNSLFVYANLANKADSDSDVNLDVNLSTFLSAD